MRRQPGRTRTGHPGVTADMHAHVMTGHEGSKFGLAPPAAAELIARIERSDRITMRGLHVHVGSQILDTAPFARSVAPVAALGDFDIYDLGGGLGARYSYADQPPAGRRVPRRTHRCGPRAPSRQCADHHRTRPQHGRDGRRHHLPRDNRQARRAHVRRGRRRHGRQPRGCAVRAALRGRHREPDGRGRPIDGSAGNHVERAVVVGRHCESGDVLVDGVVWSRPRVGDLLAVPATGAYCFTMATTTTEPAASRSCSRTRGRRARRPPRDLGGLCRARHRVSCRPAGRIDPWSERPGDGGRQSCLH